MHTDGAFCLHSAFIMLLGGSRIRTKKNVGPLQTTAEQCSPEFRPDQKTQWTHDFLGKSLRAWVGEKLSTNLGALGQTPEQQDGDIRWIRVGRQQKRSGGQSCQPKGHTEMCVQWRGKSLGTHFPISFQYKCVSTLSLRAGRPTFKYV